MLGYIATDRITEDANFGKKKKDEAHFELGWYVSKQICRIWGTEDPHANIEKPTHPKRVTVWCGFWFRAIIGPFFFENEQGEPITVNEDLYRYCSQKLKKRILATLGINMTALGATEPKLHTMFCDLYLKIALSAAEMMSFGHLRAAI